MSIVITAKHSNSIIMTSDKRVTYEELDGKNSTYSDDYKKTFSIDNKYILSYVGHTSVLENAYEYIEKNKVKIESAMNYKDKINFFRSAFLYGKKKFSEEYPLIKPKGVFFLGLIKSQNATLLGFSSDDKFKGSEYNASIKVNASSQSEETRLIIETTEYINNEIALRNGSFTSWIELADINFAAIQRVDDVKVGKTAHSVILSVNGVEEHEHKA